VGEVGEELVEPVAGEQMIASGPPRLRSWAGEGLGSVREYKVRHFLEGVLLTMIGGVNHAVCRVSRGSVVLYRFHGRSVVWLMVVGPDSPPDPIGVGYLPDGDDYIVMARDAELGKLAALRTAATVTAGIAPEQQDIPADITMLTDEAERAALLDRLLERASMSERYDLIEARELPVARLTLHGRPEAAANEAFSGI
jgi:hypothetical protein